MLEGKLSKAHGTGICMQASMDNDPKRYSKDSIATSPFSWGKSYCPTRLLSASMHVAIANSFPARNGVSFAAGGCKRTPKKPARCIRLFVHLLYVVDGWVPTVCTWEPHGVHMTLVWHFCAIVSGVNAARIMDEAET